MWGRSPLLVLRKRVEETSCSCRYTGLKILTVSSSLPTVSFPTHPPLCYCFCLCVSLPGCVTWSELYIFILFLFSPPPREGRDRCQGLVLGDSPPRHSVLPPKPLPFPMGGVEWVSRKPDTSANIHRTSVANQYQELRDYYLR